MAKIFGGFLLSALMLCAQDQPKAFSFVVNDQSPVAYAFPVPFAEVFIVDTHADGYVVTITGMDMSGKPFTMTRAVQSSGQPQTIVTFTVDAQAPLQSVTVTPYTLDKSRAVTVP